MIYSYEAKDGAGRTVTGSLDADNERAAATLVREQGYFPMRLVAQGSGAVGEAPAEPDRSDRRATGAGPSAPWLMVHVIYPLWTGVSLNELTLFYRQFAAMLRAGVPVFQCLTALIAQTGNSTFRKCLQTISADVQNGGSLRGAMGRYPWIFTDFHRAMVGAGETSGRLDLMFARLADALEQEQMLRRSIKRETFYPKAVLVCAFLLPQLFYLVKGGFGAYFTHAIMPLLLMLAIVGVVVVLNKLGSQAKGVYHAFLTMIPGIGGTVKMIALARFARTLASLFAAGLLVPEAIRSAAESCGNAYIGGRIVRAIPRVMAGGGITEPLRATGIFPPMVVSMLGTGEQTGSLDQTMDKVAEFYEAESVVRLHQAAIIVGIVALLIAAAAVFVTVLNAYQGMYGDLLKPED